MSGSFAPPADLRWLYVDFNSYFASVEQQLDPRLRGKPIAVIPVETESTCAIAASYEAKAFGIRTGTPVWEAKKLCPDLICVLGRHPYSLARTGAPLIVDICHEALLRTASSRLCR